MEYCDETSGDELDWLGMVRLGDDSQKAFESKHNFLCSVICISVFPL